MGESIPAAWVPVKRERARAALGAWRTPGGPGLQAHRDAIHGGPGTTATHDAPAGLSPPMPARWRPLAPPTTTVHGRAAVGAGGRFADGSDGVAHLINSDD